MFLTDRDYTEDMIDFVTTMLSEFWTVYCEMAPYLVFGFLFAGVLSVMIREETVERHLGGKGFWPILKASAFGVPLPLCSCGVIPVAASLRRSGSSRAATVSFLVSTPQTGVDSILVTYSLLGPVFALFRPVAALVSGMLAGLSVKFWGPKEVPKAALASPEAKDDCSDGKCGSIAIRILRYGLVTLPKDIGRSLIIGLAIAGLIAAAIPEDFFSRLIGSGLLMMALMMLMGIPLYVCATASVPVAAALMAKGVSPGAALVFLMTGPATNAATVAVIWKTMGRRTCLLYLANVAGCALASGLVLDQVYVWTHASSTIQITHILPEFVHTVCAFLLIGVLAYSMAPAWLARRTPAPCSCTSSCEGRQGGYSMKIRVTGMTCSHCVQSVGRALKGCSGVQDAQVDLAKGEAVISGEGLDPKVLCQAVRELGYEAEPIEP